jgi:hypothetical protein
MNQRYYRWNRWLHKWAGLILALQLVFWIGGGTLMASLDIDEVHGDHLHHPQDLLLAADSYKHPLNEIIKTHALQPSQVAFISIEDEPVYKLKGTTTHYFSALDGRVMPALEKDTIKDIATSLFTRQAPIHAIEILEELPMEARPLNAPMWRVDFGDSDNTSFYLHPISGELQRVRSDIWRLFNFVWMLHIMDYDERDNFNHPLLIGFAGSAFLFTFTGIIMLYQQLFRPRFRRK